MTKPGREFGHMALLFSPTALGSKEAGLVERRRAVLEDRILMH